MRQILLCLFVTLAIGQKKGPKGMMTSANPGDNNMGTMAPTGNMGTNTGNMGTNTGNTGNMGTNTGNMGTNTGNMGTNTGNMGTNTGSSDDQTTVPGLSRQPTPAARAALLDIHDTAFLFLDHQTGLFQTVKDVPLRDLRANVMVLAHAAQLVKIPMFTTASEPNGPNGPLMDDLVNFPGATYIPRKGEISAWDNADFYKAIQDSGKKTLVISGVWTSVCVTFPAIQAKADGFKVYAVMDASGDMSEMASMVSQHRMTQAGVILTTTNMIVGECQRSWNRPDAMQWAGIYGDLVPNYHALIESYARAVNQTSATPGRRR